MSYKTILVHLNDERRVGQVVDVAAHIADENEAHLIGLYVVPSPVVGSFSGLGGGSTAENARAQTLGQLTEQPGVRFDLAELSQLGCSQPTPRREAIGWKLRIKVVVK